MNTEELLSKGRLPCPKCARKGVGYAMHAHAYGWKDYDKAICRYCRARFNVGSKPKNPDRADER